MKKIKFTIEGMHCASCSSNVERAVKKVKGVKEVVVSLMTNKAFVDAEENVNKEEIEKAIEKAIKKVGYKVVGIEE
jgi:P-type Cu+ transporter